MKTALINDLVDQLLARDGAYRPLELLLALRRIDREGLANCESATRGFLEDQLYGSTDVVMEQLDWAAKRAKNLGLTAETQARRSGQGALFRRATADLQARTIWRRAEVSAQADLFLDNRLSLARAQLVRALSSANRGQAETALLELSRADPGNELQADAEHLVGALGWLQAEALDDQSQTARVLDALNGDLAVRARRLLGAEAAQSYLARFFSHLADTSSPQAPAESSNDSGASDQSDDVLSPAQLRFKAGDMAGALRELDAQQSTRPLSSELRLIELRASLRLEQRERALMALSQLCWTDANAAEAWLEQGEDDELARRVEQFWDLEDPLDVELFPAWLLARGYPMPTVEAAPDHNGALALERIRALRVDPADRDARQWLHDHCPELMQNWLGQR